MITYTNPKRYCILIDNADVNCKLKMIHTFLMIKLNNINNCTKFLYVYIFFK